MADEEKVTSTISVDLNKDQYDFLVKWQKTHEEELGIEVPLGALVRKTVDAAMKSRNSKTDTYEPRKYNSDSHFNKGAGDSGSRPSFSGDRSFGSRPSGDRSFGSRPSSGPRRPSMLPKRVKRF